MKKGIGFSFEIFGQLGDVMQSRAIERRSHHASSSVGTVQVVVGMLVIVLALFGCWCGESKAQSGYSGGIAGPHIPGQRVFGGRADGASWPPNSMSREMRRWETLLDRTYPGRLRDEMAGSELIAKLSLLGLPTVIEQSAKDDSFAEDEPIQLHPALVNSSLRARLIQGLAEKNATIVFRRNYISVISLDDAEDTRFSMTVVYDVTDLNASPRTLTDTIQNTILIDSWMETGQGLGTIASLPVNSRELLAITQTYGVHREVQQLLAGFHRLAGGSTQSNPRRLGTNVVRTNSMVAAQAVVVPVEPAPSEDHRNYQRETIPRQDRRNYQHGGVFSVSEELR